MSLYPTEAKVEGANTTVIVVVVIAVLSILAALSVFLALKYEAKSPKVKPSEPEKQTYGANVKHGVTKKKKKHSSSTTGIGDGPRTAMRSEVQVGEKKKGRRKRSSSSPKVRVGSQIQNLKGRQVSTKQDSTKETPPAL